MLLNTLKNKKLKKKLKKTLEARFFNANPACHCPTYSLS